jgi:hypothetical protein
MVRNIVLALATTAVIAGTGLIPTAASAGWYDRDSRADRRDIARDRADLHRDWRDLRSDLRYGSRRDIARDLRDIRRDWQDLRSDRRDYYRDRYGYR